jgi:hypothetical protein
MSAPHRDSVASQSSIVPFLRPIVPKVAVAALGGGVAAAPITDGGVIIIDDDDAGNPLGSAPAGPAVRTATTAVAPGGTTSAQLPVRRRRVNDDDAVAVPVPIAVGQAAPTARRRRIIDDDDDDDAIAAPVPAAAAALPLQVMPADASDPDEADQFEGEVTFPHYCEMCPE